MSRPDNHKELVNAIVDGEIDAQTIVTDAVAIAGTLSAKLDALARNIIKLRIAGKLTVAKARDLYRTMYVSIALAGFTEVAQDVVDHADESTQRIIDAARKLGSDVKNVTEITNEDKLARELERNGA